MIEFFDFDYFQGSHPLFFSRMDSIEKEVPVIEPLFNILNDKYDEFLDSIYSTIDLEDQSSRYFAGHQHKLNDSIDISQKMKDIYIREYNFVTSCAQKYLSIKSESEHNSTGFDNQKEISFDPISLKKEPSEENRGELIQKINQRKENLKALLNYITCNFDPSEYKADHEIIAFVMSFPNNCDQEIVNVGISLCQRYQKIKKTKEEMLKFIVRKGFKIIKKKFYSRYPGAPKKKIFHLFMNHFFGLELSQSTTEKKNFFLPFRKTSHTKTINKKYLKGLFNHKKFANEFRDYLENYLAYTDCENKKKIELFYARVTDSSDGKINVNCMKSKQMPWLKSWKINCYNLLQDILEML